MDLQEEERFASIFFPYSNRQVHRVQKENISFVHYTSASTALDILIGQQVWMRNATVMNDFSEISHGVDCLTKAYSSKEGEEFFALLDGISPGTSAEIKKLMHDWGYDFRLNTYITSVSEHDKSEDVLGRLSMWRAYGGDCGAAIVFSNKPFLSRTDALAAYSSPVLYADSKRFIRNLDEINKNMKNNIEFLKEKSQYIVDFIFHMFRFSILSTKHPGFHEEREWRILYSPEYTESRTIELMTRTIAGIPQLVAIIPLRNKPEIGIKDIEVKDILERIIIGPTQYPWVIFNAFKKVLKDLNVENPDEKIFVSDIPLRT